MSLTNEDLQAIKALIEQSVEQSIERSIEPINKRLTNIELTLENETNKGIKIIGEGHAILNRRLDEALKVTSEAELLQLRVLRLENELRQVKERLQEIIA